MVSTPDEEPVPVGAIQRMGQEAVSIYRRAADGLTADQTLGTVECVLVLTIAIALFVMGPLASLIGTLALFLLVLRLADARLDLRSRERRLEKLRKEQP